MLKLLIMNDYIRGGGVEKVLSDIVKYLDNKQYKITLLSIDNDMDTVKILYPKQIEYISLDGLLGKKPRRRQIFNYIFYRLRYIGLKYKLTSFLNKEQFDVLIAFKEGICMKFLEKVKAKKKFAWVHVDYNALHWTKGVFKTEDGELKCMQNYDHVICVSKACLDSVESTIGNPGNMLVRYNPIDVKDILSRSKEQVACLQAYDYDKTKTIFVTVGRLSEQKGYMRLLACCNKLKNKFDYELWIVGEGEQREQIEEYLSTHHLNCVKLWGQQDNPYPFIVEADWFVSSSFAESYGIAVQEAVVLDKPVIATECPAFKECLSDEVAMLVENSEEGLYDGLYKVLADKQLKESFVLGKLAGYSTMELYNDRLKEIEKLWL